VLHGSCRKGRKCRESRYATAELVNKKWRRKPNGLCRSESHRVAVLANALLQFEVSERTDGEGHQARLRCATKSSQRNTQRNLKSTILRRSPWCRTSGLQYVWSSANCSFYGYELVKTAQDSHFTSFLARKVDFRKVSCEVSLPVSSECEYDSPECLQRST